MEFEKHTFNEWAEMPKGTIRKQLSDFLLEDDWFEAISAYTIEDYKVLYNNSLDAENSIGKIDTVFFPDRIKDNLNKLLIDNIDTAVDAFTDKPARYNYTIKGISSEPAGICVFGNGRIIEFFEYSFFVRNLRMFGDYRACGLRVRSGKGITPDEKLFEYAGEVSEDSHIKDKIFACEFYLRMYRETMDEYCLNRLELILNSIDEKSSAKDVLYYIGEIYTDLVKIFCKNGFTVKAKEYLYKSLIHEAVDLHDKSNNCPISVKFEDYGRVMSFLRKSAASVNLSKEFEDFVTEVNKKYKNNFEKTIEA